MVLFQGARLIWYNRNLPAHGQDMLSPSSAVHMLKVQSRQSFSRQLIICGMDLYMTYRWYTPVQDFLKINVDGAWDKAARKAGIGLCCRTDAGLVIVVEVDF